jgi:hypothetical protein
MKAMLNDVEQVTQKLGAKLKLRAANLQGLADML